MPLRDDRVAMRAKQEALEREVAEREAELVKLREGKEDATEQAERLRKQVGALQMQARLHKKIGIAHVLWFVVIGLGVVIAFWVAMAVVDAS